MYINGKFCAQRTTGVQRVARNLVLALDRLVRAGGAPAGVRWVLLCPPGAPQPALDAVQVRSTGRGQPAGALGLHLWEQLELPRAARGGLLLNLSGSAPAFARRQACLWHDAAVFDRPAHYGAAFRCWYRWLFRRLARRAEVLLAPTAFARDRLAAALGLAPGRIAVVGAGAGHLGAVPADPAVLQRWSLRPGGFFLAVGSIAPGKNLGAVLRALALLAGRRPHDPPRLVVAGGGDARVFAAAQLPATPGVVFAGPVDDAQLRALYENAAALVQASTYEGLGLPPLEAMACGCPVAAARAAALPEVCADAALYFDPDAPEQLAALLEQLMDDAGLRRRMADTGRQQAARWSWDRAAVQLWGPLAPAALAEGGAR